MSDLNITAEPRTLTEDSTIGGDRPVEVLVPSGYDPSVPTPLVLLLHGFGVDRAIQSAYLRMEPAADAAREEVGGAPPTNRMAVAVLALVGLFVALFLWAHNAGLTGPIQCGIGDCATVQSSEFARIGPVPVSAIGVAGYAALVGLALLGLQPAHRDSRQAALRRRTRSWPQPTLLCLAAARSVGWRPVWLARRSSQRRTRAAPLSPRRQLPLLSRSAKQQLLLLPPPPTRLQPAPPPKLPLRPQLPRKPPRGPSWSRKRRRPPPPPRG